MLQPDSQRSASGRSATTPTGSPLASSPAGGGSTSQIPTLTLPKGGGALRGLDEQFHANPATGTASLSIPLPLSPGRDGFEPSLTLSYDSGAGNGPFGLGWSLGLGGVARRTEQGLPRYNDNTESDEFRLSGGEVLVPALRLASSQWLPDEYTGPAGERVRRYCPRLEGAFVRIENITPGAGGPSYWRVTSGANVTTVYGQTAAARVADPANPDRIFEWLPELSYDDRGNCLVYEYKVEDLTGVPRRRAEENRHAGRALFTNQYLKRVRYGNRQPYTATFLANPYAPLPPTGLDFLFKVVLDYGEHDLAAARPDLESRPWPARPDAGSDYRAGFERRTYRRCAQVLLFHQFAELGATPYLVRGLALGYHDTVLDAARPQPLEMSYLTTATHTGYQRLPAGNYASQALPPLLFHYQEVAWQNQVQEVHRLVAPNAPQGISGPYRFVDLYGEGLAGLLSEQAGAWYYEQNEGDGSFGPAHRVAQQPSFVGAGEQLVLQPLEADGRLRAVSLVPGATGSWTLTEEPTGDGKLGWEAFRPFDYLPNLDWQDPSLRLIDLTGDGRPDLLLTENEAFVHYEAEGVRGYAPALRTTRPHDEEWGPALVFAEGEQSIFLADMSGDGLTDLVRIRNGSVCYWPNLGYGRFGAKVEMDDAPVFDRPDLFDPRYLRLADVSGTGVADLLYLTGTAPRAWLNLSGNRWSAPTSLPALPPAGVLAQLDVLDLLGTGTACLVWSSGGLPGAAHAPLRFVDLMGALRPGQASAKPHVLIGYENNMGREVRFGYRPSTQFFLEDRRAGTPWGTRLPFPVPCLARVRTEDKVRETVFVTSYRYRHGYYDGLAREFRGFGRVEQLDTETYADFGVNSARNVVAEDLHQPPVRTLTWFHTGAFFDRSRLLHQFRNEYFQNAALPEAELAEPPLPTDLSAEEAVEALRAYKGLVLHTEAYADDGTALAALPYGTASSTYRIYRVQPRLSQRHAVLQAVPAEALSFAYDRRPHDPRISHSIVLKVNELGQPTQSASVVYPRAARPAVNGSEAVPDVVWEAQNRRHISLSETDYTNDVLTAATHRRRVSCAQRTYELLATPASEARALLTAPQLCQAAAEAGELAFEGEADGTPQKRLLSHSRAYFRADDLRERLPLGQLAALGLGYEGQTLAFTAGLVALRYGDKVTADLLKEVGYQHSEGDADWWLPSGQALYAADAVAHFLRPYGVRDALQAETTVGYDAYDLLAVQTADALGNTTVAELDYRTLSPVRVTDPNGNQAAVATDALGLPVSIALLGKSGAGEGDTLADPTTRLEYSLDNWRLHGQPNFARTLAREQHGAANPRWQESFTYFDGGGAVLLTKTQANPGPARRWDDATQAVVEVPADPRWVGSGRTIFDNKGYPVKRYEPYFSATAAFENERALVETGVSALVHYDPVGRNFQTDLPNGTFTKTEFTPWLTRQFDPNDTVRDARWYQERGAPDPAGSAPTASPEARAAWLAARHHGTPATVHLDALGQPVLAVADYGASTTSTVRTATDPAGRWVRLYDQLDREVSFMVNNLAGQTFYTETAEKGRYWLLPNAVGGLARGWDNDRRTLRNVFDGLHRPRFSYCTEEGLERLISAVVWGEGHPDAQARNLRGRPCQVYDGAGVVTVERVDFKGNTLEASRRLTLAYRGVADWRVLETASTAPEAAAAAAPLLTAEAFGGHSSFDALNRPVVVTLPDGSVLRPHYNEANSLADMSVQVRGQGAFVSFMQGQDYDAKGQRRYVRYGNGAVTRYFYDPHSFRLTRLLTLTAADPDDQAVQDLRYTYDPVGNITTLRDDAQATHFFQNAVVAAGGEFEYDALYQLIRATGREHAGLAAAAQPDYSDLPFVPQLPHANNAGAVRNYTETYQYDMLGNLLELRHSAGPAGSFTRRYQYDYQLNPASRTNRLAATSRATDAAGAFSDTYPTTPLDPHHHLTSLPHLPALVWDYFDQLVEVDLGGGGRACYQYNGGQRVRKVVERPGGLRQERLYLGAVEVYREWQGPAPAPHLERWTLHVADDTGRIAQVDTKTLDPGGLDLSNPLGTPVVRYQLHNHLGSATVELDAIGQVISYEEYHPFGTSAYRSARPGNDLSLKRYRYASQERDDETGLYYMSARYYVPWLGRWLSSDPAGFADGLNLYAYCRNNPVMLHDPDGTQSQSSDINNATCAYLLGGPDGLIPYPLVPGGCDPAPSGPAAPSAPVPQAKAPAKHAPAKHTPLKAQPAAEAAPPPAEPPPDPTPAPASPSAPTTTAAAPPTDSSIGAPGFAESLIPIWGSGREALNHFQHGNVGRGVFWTAMAVSDIFLVKAVGTAVVKGIGRIGLGVAAREIGQVGAEATAHTAVATSSETLVHLTNATGEAAINSSQRVGGRWGIFALKAGKVPTSSFGRRAASLVPGDLSRSIAIGGEATAAFAKPPVYGVFTGLRRLAGVRSTPLGAIDLATGRFIEGEILRRGVFRTATRVDRAAFIGHQAFLDTVPDGLIYSGVKVGGYISDTLAGAYPADPLFKSVANSLIEFVDNLRSIFYKR
jgi:RHS repeat-associated protein